MEGYSYNITGTAQVGTGALDFASGSVSFIFKPMSPVEIVRWGVTMTVALSGSDLVMTGNHRQLAGAALTPSGAGDVGTVTATSNATTGGGAIGNSVYTERVNPNADFGNAGGDRTAAGSETAVLTKPFLVLPGEEVQFVSDNGPSTSNGYIWVIYRQLPYQASTTKRARAALTAPKADTNWLVDATEVTS